MKKIIFSLSSNEKLLFVSFFVAFIFPFLNGFLPREFQIAEFMRSIFIFSLLGLGLNIVTGYTGLLHLGAAAFMAIGAYAFSIFTCDIYPFQLGFWMGTLIAILVGTCFGFILGLPSVRLRGDYLALVTMGFGEIVQDALKNLDAITKGTQGINPLPPPHLYTFNFSQTSYVSWYYLLFSIVALAVLFSFHLERSRIGRAWTAIREDELASRCMGIPVSRMKLLSFAISAGLCSLAGALSASYLGSSGEPANYDFQVSVMAICIIIIGGLGNLAGVLLGAGVLIGFNDIFLNKLATWLTNHGLSETGNVFLSPNNWKYLFFGLTLILVTRFRPLDETGAPSSR